MGIELGAPSAKLRCLGRQPADRKNCLKSAILVRQAPLFAGICNNPRLATTPVSHTFTGVISKWKDRVTKKTGEQLAGTRTNPKTLKHLYTSKRSAKRAAKLEWAKIREVRDIIRENNDEPIPDKGPDDNE
jgi:hypothetical protein